MGQEGRVPLDSCSCEEIGRSAGMMDSGYQNSGSIPHLAVQTLLRNLNLSVLATSSVRQRENYLAHRPVGRGRGSPGSSTVSHSGGEHRVWRQIALWQQMSISTALKEANLSLTKPWKRWPVTCTNKNSTFPRRPMTTFLETKKARL